MEHFCVVKGPPVTTHLLLLVFRGKIVPSFMMLFVVVEYETITRDGSTTNRPGARFGPSAIREASQMLCDGPHPLFDAIEDPVDALGDVGDVHMPNTSLVGMREALEVEGRKRCCIVCCALPLLTLLLHTHSTCIDEEAPRAMAWWGSLDNAFIASCAVQTLESSIGCITF
jgi:hypothetical protein